MVLRSTAQGLMSASGDINHRVLAKKAMTPPLDQLYIYYLDGTIDAQAAVLGRNFLGNWEEEGMSFLFFSAPADAVIDDLCRQRPFPRLADTYQMTYAQWLGEAFATSVIGRFTITPPWELTPAEPDQRIILDPGLVFGTGTHPTTRDCIFALENAFQRAEINTVMDLGAGTGLLSIVSAKLGAKAVAAVDLNALAANTTWHNIQLNGLTDKILAIRADAQQFIENRADLVIANIHYAVMQKIIVTPGFLAKKAFILSGLMRSEAREIASRLKHLPVKIIREWNSDGIWTTFSGAVIT